MKQVRRSLAVILLTLSLTVVAFADGQMDTPVAPPNPVVKTDGQMDTPIRASSEGDEGIADALTEMALGLWESLRALF